jgi:hypothetical protein
MVPRWRASASMADVSSTCMGDGGGGSDAGMAVVGLAWVLAIVLDTVVIPGMFVAPPKTVPMVPLRVGFLAFSSFQISSMDFF